MPSIVSIYRALVVVVVLSFVGAGAPAQEATGVLKRAATAMGADELKSLRYAGDGVGYSFGQAYKPGMPWPKFTVHSQVRTINYDSGSMRDEIVLSRAEPRGGGGYPLVAQQRNDQYVSGAFAWNQTGPAPVPGARFVGDRVHQLWITPHGVVKAAMRNSATLRWLKKDGKSIAAVSFTEPGRFAATAFIDDEYLVQRVESRAPDAVLGENVVVTTYRDYRDSGGVKFPGRIEQSSGGHPVLELSVKEVLPNAPADFPVPELVRAASERVTTEKIADGVWFVAGGSHNSVAIEMKDHLVLVEAPLGDLRSAPVIEQVKQLAPGKPLTHVINTHSHFDHAGGLRAAAAEGATVITHADNVPYFERAFVVHSKLNPDRLTKSGKKAKFKAVNDKLSHSDGTRTLEIVRITDSVHSATFLMVYLPNEKLLVEADAYTPGAPNTPPPDPPNANHVNLVGNIDRLKLSIDRIAPIHGRVVPVGELYTQARAIPPK